MSTDALDNDDTKGQSEPKIVQEPKGSDNPTAETTKTNSDGGEFDHWHRGLARKCTELTDAPVTEERSETNPDDSAHDNARAVSIPAETTATGEFGQENVTELLTDVF